MPTNCPRCGSGHISSNNITIIPNEHVPDGVNIARNTGHPAIAACLIAVWGVTQAVNAFREDWCCDHCDHRFS